MSDNLHRYRAIRDALTQCYPGQPTGTVARHLTTLAALISGIVGSKSTQLPSVATKIPDGTKPESRVKRLTRWLDNERIMEEVYFLPYVGLDHGVGHPASFSLSHCSSRWTEGCRRNIDCPQYSGKHRAGLLPEKPLRCRGPVRPREEEVVHRGQTFPLSGAVQSS
jgi:hypothetical protein